MNTGSKLKTALVISEVAALIGFTSTYIITGSFVARTIVLIYVDLLLLPIPIAVFRRAFRNVLSASMNRAMAVCTAALLLDIVLDTVRFCLSGGTRTLPFLPLCVPLCMLAISLYSHKDSGRDKGELKLILGIGIPLTLLALAFEFMSVADIIYR